MSEFWQVFIGSFIGTALVAVAYIIGLKHGIHLSREILKKL